MNMVLSVFSLVSMSNLPSSVSSNFECGFYPVLSTQLKYRFHYFFVVVHFIIFEQELLICILYIFSNATVISSLFLIILLAILFVDLL